MIIHFLLISGAHRLKNKIQHSAYKYFGESDRKFLGTFK